MADTALITGASRGIGKAIALRLAEQGYACFLVGRDARALEAVCADCRALGAEADYAAADLSDGAGRAEVLEAAGKRFGRVDVLVNNAGTAHRAAVQEAHWADWQRVLDLNLAALMDLSRLALPGMIERRRGAIVNISSLSGRHGAAGNAAYAASKHAVNGFSDCLYEDARDYGIKVSAIMPGFVDTDLTAGLARDAGNMIRASDVADAVAFVLAASPHCCPTEIVLRPQRRP